MGKPDAVNGLQAALDTWPVNMAIPVSRREIIDTLAYVAELERVNEAAQICVRNWKAGAVTMNWVIDALAAALTGGNSALIQLGGGDPNG